MKFRRWILVAAAFSLHSFANAQKPPAKPAEQKSTSSTSQTAVCNEFLKAIDFRIRQAAYNAVVAQYENDVTEALAMVEVNVRMMQANNCKVPTTPITGREYQNAANICEVAILKRQTQLAGDFGAQREERAMAQKRLPECNLEAWIK